MNYSGVDAKIIRNVMSDYDVTALEELIALAQELSGRLVSCDMSQELLGIGHSELLEGIEHGDVATFLSDAARAKATLFI